VELRSAGERSRAENSWTFICECGAQESANTKKETLREWRLHIASVKRQALRQLLQKLAQEVKDQCYHAAVVGPLHFKTPESAVASVDLDSFVDRAMEDAE